MNVFEVTDERADDFSSKVQKYLKTNGFEVDLEKIKSAIYDISAGDMLTLANAIGNDDFDDVERIVGNELLNEYALPNRHDVKSSAYDRPKPNGKPQSSRSAGNAQADDNQDTDDARYPTATIGTSDDSEEEDEEFTTSLNRSSRDNSETGRKTRSPRSPNRTGNQAVTEDMEGPFYTECGCEYYYHPTSGRYYDTNTGEWFDDAELFVSEKKRYSYLEMVVESRSKFLENQTEHRRDKLVTQVSNLLAKSRVRQ